MAPSDKTPFHEPGNSTQGFKATKDCFLFIHERFESMGCRGRFMVPMRVRWLEVEAPHEPPRSGRHPACSRGPASCRPDLLPFIHECGLFRRFLRRAGSPGSTAGRIPAATVQGFNARKWISRNSHPDPLPFSQRGEGKVCPVTAGFAQSFVRTFHIHCSRRSEEADGLVVCDGPPPHVDGYGPLAFQSACQIIGLAVASPIGRGSRCAVCARVRG